jgi:transient receptor potential cation channel subfamily M protein 2
LIGFAKLFAYLFYVIGAILRFIPHDSNDYYPETYQWARRVLSLDICLFFWRGLEFFFIQKKLGPKLTMIYKMIGDVAVFLNILLVWLISYGVAVQALLFPFEEGSWSLLRKIVEVPYWQMHGEIFFEHLSGEAVTDCIPYPLANTTADYIVCPQKEWLVLVLLAGYLIITVILLLNLLIATFNDTYRDVQDMSTLIWKFQRYYVINEYKNKFLFLFPHPFYWLSFVIYWCRTRMSDIKTSDIKTSDNDDLRMERSSLKSDRCRRMEFLELQSRKEVVRLNKEAK